MSQSTKTKSKLASNNLDYPRGHQWISKASEPLTDEERAAIDAYYQNEAVENAESVSAEELMARLRRK
jgi:hypothetical protein